MPASSCRHTRRAPSGLSSPIHGDQSRRCSCQESRFGYVLWPRVWRSSGSSRLTAQNPNGDFGVYVAAQLSARRAAAVRLHAPARPERARSLHGTGQHRRRSRSRRDCTCSLVSSAVHFSTDQIALWPDDDDHPTHLFVCDEETSNPGRAARRSRKPAARERDDDRHRAELLRSGSPHAVGHDHRRGRSGRDRRLLRDPRSGAHQRRDQRDQSRCSARPAIRCTS